jgi:hypothetical protein
VIPLSALLVINDDRNRLSDPTECAYGAIQLGMGACEGRAIT